ncbi:hypothetical protein D3C86_2021600 [compost metagenome]
MFRALVNTVTDMDRFFEMVLDPRNIFENGRCRVPVAQMHMHLAHFAGMRHHRQAMGEREIGNLDIFGYAAEPGHIRLDIGHRAGIDE